MTSVETLVATVVTSVGLLGIGALHLVSLKDNLQANFRSQANILTIDIIERMRANREDAIEHRYNVDFGALSQSSSAVAKEDVDSWKLNLKRLLPNGDGSIEQASEVIVITIQWRDRQGSPSTLTSNARL